MAAVVYPRATGDGDGVIPATKGNRHAGDDAVGRGPVRCVSGGGTYPAGWPEGRLGSSHLVETSRGRAVLDAGITLLVVIPRVDFAVAVETGGDGTRADAALQFPALWPHPGTGSHASTRPGCAADVDGWRAQLAVTPVSYHFALG